VALLDPTIRMTLRLVAVVLVLGGCATGADVVGLATQEEVLRLRGDVTGLQRAVQQAKTQTETLSSRLAERSPEQSAESDRQTQTLTQRIDRLTTTLTALTQRVDELEARLAGHAGAERSSDGDAPGGESIKKE